MSRAIAGRRAGSGQGMETVETNRGIGKEDGGWLHTCILRKRNSNAKAPSGRVQASFYGTERESEHSDTISVA